MYTYIYIFEDGTVGYGIPGQDEFQSADWRDLVIVRVRHGTPPQQYSKGNWVELSAYGIKD